MELLGEVDFVLEHMDEGAIGFGDDDFGVALLDFYVNFPIFGEFLGCLVNEFVEVSGYTF